MEERSLRSNVQFDNAKFITYLAPYQEKDEIPREYVPVDKMVNNAVVFVPEKPIPDDANLRLYQSRIVVSKIGHPPEKALQKVRGVVSYTFSRKCRRRMMNATHSIQWPDESKKYHVILTYPKTYPDDWRLWKVHLKAFKRKLQAKFGDSVVGYWRLELQQRGAPHYHFLFSLPKGVVTNKKLMKLITQWWASIAHMSDQYQGEYATKVKVVPNDAAIQSYVSKYCAKVTSNQEPDESDAYIHPGEQFRVERALFQIDQIQQKTIGRQWGRIGKPNEAPLFELNISLQEQYLLKSVIIPILASWFSSFAAKLLHKPDSVSWQVYGIKGYALALVWNDLSPPRDECHHLNPFKCVRWLSRADILIS